MTTWPRSASSASACAVHTGVAQRMFKALADAKINIQNITTSEIKISCIINKEDGGQGAADSCMMRLSWGKCLEKIGFQINDQPTIDGR